MTSALEVILPVHNEAESIEATLREWHSELRSLSPTFIVCEDGSRDQTVAVVRALAEELPIKLLTSSERKGYSRAVIDGMVATTSDFVLCVDSDGQCDPTDVWRLWNERHRYDLVKGRRTKREDPFVRRFLSGLFRLYYTALFPVPGRDPSCPYLLMRKAVIDRLLPELGVLDQGFWWEFVARAHRRNFTMLEVPVSHRPRAAGMTQVYRWRRMPRIGISHGLGLLVIWWQTRT